MSRSARVLSLLAAVVTLVAGCGFRGVYDMPLPGGADVGDHPYSVRVWFADVLDLVPNADVRVNNVPVGRVTDIGLAPQSWQGEVTVQLNGKVRLPANATAHLRQSSLLGEKYVELDQPDQPQGRLGNGALIGLDRTNRNPEVEEVLGALSLLLNGGGVAQLQNITRELNAALQGRESDVRGLLSNVDKLVSGLDAQRADITRALDGVNRLSANLNAQRDNIATALDHLQPGLRVLDQQRHQLVTMLQSLDRLSTVGTDVVNRTQDDLVHNLQQLQPTLRQLAAAGDSLPKSLQVLLTFPFPDNAVEGIKGSDYTNLYINADLNLTHILNNLGRSRLPLIHPPNLPLPLPPPAAQPAPQPGSPTPPPTSGPPPVELPIPTPTPSPTQPPDDDSGGLLDFLLGGD